METPLIQSPSIPRPRHPQLGGGENDHDVSGPAPPNNTPVSASTTATSSPSHGSLVNPAPTSRGSAGSSPTRRSARSRPNTSSSTPTSPVFGPLNEGANDISYRTSSGQPLPPTPPKDNRDSDSDASNSDDDTIVAVGSNTDGAASGSSRNRRPRRSTVNETSPRSVRTGRLGGGILRRNTLPRSSPSAVTSSVRLNRARLLGSGRLGLGVSTSTFNGAGSHRQPPGQIQEEAQRSETDGQDDRNRRATNATNRSGRTRGENMMAGLRAVGYLDNGPNYANLNTDPGIGPSTGPRIDPGVGSSSGPRIDPGIGPSTGPSTGPSNRDTSPAGADTPPPYYHNQGQGLLVQNNFRNYWRVGEAYRNSSSLIRHLIMSVIACAVALLSVVWYNHYYGGRSRDGVHWRHWRLSSLAGMATFILYSILLKQLIGWMVNAFLSRCECY